MRRREFIACLGSVATWSRSAASLEPTLPVIGYLDSRSPSSLPSFVNGWRVGLREAGYAEDQNLKIAYQWGEGRYDRVSAQARDLVERRVALILAAGNAPALAAKATTASIPIVFVVGIDPVGSGLVSSLSRPGGNVTGVTIFANALVSKRLELLRELSPPARVVGVLVNPKNPSSDAAVRLLNESAATLGLQVQIRHADTEAGIASAFAAFAQERVGALLVHADTFFDTQRSEIAALASSHRLLAIYNNREYAASGGLISYGEDRFDSYRQAGHYVARILKGTKPADLPVLQPTKFELVINLKSAKALRITIPPALLARADEVME